MPTTLTSQFMPIAAHRRVRVAVPSTETSPWIVVNEAATVVAAPGTSMKVQATCSLLSTVIDDNNNGTSNSLAFDWPVGAVTVVTSEQVRNVTAVRFIAIAGAGVGEVGT